jgi:putative peptidoglycan lipid II flippase
VESPTSAPLPSGRPGIASAAALLAAGNASSRLLGLVREQVFAALFGATGAMSAFRTATRLSTAVYDLLLSGATTSALVPVFSDYIQAGRREELSRIASTLINLTLLGIGAIVALLILAAPLVVQVLGADAEHFALAVELTRIALPSILLLGVSGVLTALLYARQSFAVPAFASAVYNAGVIVAALALTPSLSISALALGLGLGALLQILIQLPALRGLRYLPILDLRHPGVRLILRLYAPVFLGMLVSYAVVMIDTHLAWTTGPESVAAMAFATTLVQFPIGLVGAAASLAILPALSRLATAGDDAQFVATLMRGVRSVVLLIVPLGLALAVLREPVVAVLFERLAFDAQATQRTATAFLAYAPQLPFVVVDQLLIVAFYARKRTLTPVLVGVAGAAVYLVVALATVVPLGMAGLALANAVQNSAHAVVLYTLLAREHPAMRHASLGGFGLRIVVSSLACALALALGSTALAETLAGASLLGRLGAVAVAGTIGVGAYALTLIALRAPERAEAAAILARFVRPRRRDGLRP